MISTGALQIGFLSSLAIINEGSSLTIVKEGSSLTIVNETTSFIKTIVFKIDHFKKTNFKKKIVFKTIVSFSIFRHRFHNETFVFQKNENVNIPAYALYSGKQNKTKNTSE